MVQTTVIPEKANLDMSVLLPDNYVGRQVHVLFYTDNEVNNTTVSVTPKKKPSDFFGTVSLEEGEKFQEYIAQSRKEWDKPKLLADEYREAASENIERSKEFAPIDLDDWDNKY